MESTVLGSWQLQLSPAPCAAPRLITPRWPPELRCPGCWQHPWVGAGQPGVKADGPGVRGKKGLCAAPHAALRSTEAKFRL